MIAFRIGDFVRDVVTGRPYKIVRFDGPMAELHFVSYRGKTYLWGKNPKRLPVCTLMYDEKRRWRNPTPKE